MNLKQPSDLSIRLRQALEKSGSHRPILSDDQVQWNGSDILEKLRPLHDLLQKHSLPGGRVGIGFPNWAVQALAIGACLTCDRVPVIMSHSDLRSSAPAWLAESKVSLLLTTSDLEPLLPNSFPVVVLSRQGTVLQSRLRGISWTLKEIVHRPPHGTGLMLFTSGTTGKPKGVYVPADGLLKTSDFLIKYFGLGSETRAPILLPVCHSMALNTQLLPTWLAGGHAHFVNPRLSMSRMYRSILESRGTFVSLIGEVLRACWEEKSRKNLPPSLLTEHVQLAGGMISPKHLEMARDLFPNAVLHKGYGLTEAIRVTMISSRDGHFESNAVGTPLPFVDVQIRDSDRVVFEPGVVGEIFVRGPNVMLGVSGLRKNLLDRDGFYATGDFGSWNRAGEVCISGREDSLFKINGHRVSGSEIERTVVETSELIRQAKCLCVDEAKRFGQKLVLLVEVQMDSQREFLENHLHELHGKIWTRFKSLSHFPREIIVMPKFPRTSNGKLAVKKLMEMCATSQRISLISNTSSALQFYRFPSEITERLSG